MRSLLAVALLLAPASAAAQRLGYEDVLSGGPRLGYGQVEVAEEAGPIAHFYGDRIEVVPEGDGYGWDLSGEIGNGPHRLWLATAGGGAFGGPLDYVEGQLLYSHPVLESGLALQAGVRRDFVEPRRTHAVIGMQGNVNSPLYIGLFAFLSNESEVTGRVYAYYDWEPARRLVLQPFAGLSASAEDIPALGLGRGLNSAELGFRVRYRIAEPFAPYLGLRYDRLLGRTADLARLAGEDVDNTAFLLGFRSYF